MIKYLRKFEEAIRFIDVMKKKEAKAMITFQNGEMHFSELETISYSLSGKVEAKGKAVKLWTERR
ncbi:hypothetical protein [Streptococcus parauberis]|uniref:hypothetical protein n=1 Tax=Streptococcus parauberis TaxID=1348 RepID=UPI0007A86551|nr:hypothetical protein [Streptococcus parauberis]QBX18167.1 hypothetical protein Javan399_0027 [Streptococcus phage Javan399]KYP20796.1 hypothetical protein AKL13_00415 [Streptococcus parauberis]KYP21180.1 hypothetical protein TN39_00338 [Streptococcus parauberis]KYP22424.1 hypothetical protein AKL14_00424 [Streptococcus parauberis]KYP24839.1 hypothetical protein ADO04_01122 [Streptococcus parauberis]